MAELIKLESGTAILDAEAVRKIAEFEDAMMQRKEKGMDHLSRS